MAQVKKGDKVKVHYTGKLDNGTVFDSSKGRNPLEFTIGDGKIIPGFEEAVISMQPGESKTIKIEAEKAYGPYRKELVAEIEKSKFPENIKPEIGQQLQVKQENGQMIIVMIIGFSDTHVTLDANHPLAGRDLTFELELVEIV